MHVLLSGRAPQQSTRRWSSRAHGWHLRTGFGLQLGLARVEASITRAGVFEATGIRGLRLAKLEAGADPSVRELYLLRDLYRLDLAEAVRRAKLDSHRDRTTVPAARLRLTNDSVNPRITIDGPNPPTTISTPERVEPASAAEPGASTKLRLLVDGSSGNRWDATVRASTLVQPRTDPWEPPPQLQDKRHPAEPTSPCSSRSRREQDPRIGSHRRAPAHGRRCRLHQGDAERVHDADLRLQHRRLVGWCVNEGIDPATATRFHAKAYLAGMGSLAPMSRA